MSGEDVAGLAGGDGKSRSGWSGRGAALLAAAASERVVDLVVFIILGSGFALLLDDRLGVDCAAATVLARRGSLKGGETLAECDRTGREGGAPGRHSSPSSSRCESRRE